MKKLLLLATISVAGLVSANTVNPLVDLKGSKEQKSEKIEIKPIKASSLVVLIAGTSKCYDYDKDGKLVEVKCPAVIITNP
ncbi:hypothetical protein [Chryseobacterium sp. FH1]|uniref:hypothetical protein n=1 Tax=Chryseobacterium sp. FH1 TaxID=1233951 RepID=UPI0004E38DED|nr:hypothetical protein [Chryseobacterium sp. FH1]KFC19700.1 hypothetical protein IO90_10560 [Chryseobacterium sp. FH1]